MGKRRLGKTLREFPHANEVELVWRSYQLDPELRPESGKSIHEYLADAGAEGVPFFVIDRRYGFTGAQQSEFIREILAQAWSRQLQEENLQL